MKELKKWSTRGGKYEIILIRDSFGYMLKELTNGRVSSSTSYGSKDLNQVLESIQVTIEDNKTYNGITYKEIEL